MRILPFVVAMESGCVRLPLATYTVLLLAGLKTPVQVPKLACHFGDLRTLYVPHNCTDMKILQANTGALTDFEVLDFLRSRGATSDPMGCIGGVAKSECRVFDYLNSSAACNQSTEAINEFIKRCDKFKLAKAEMLNIINMRPSTLAEIDPLIEKIDERFPRNEDDGTSEIDDLVNLVVEVLPPPPKSEEEASGEQETA